MRTAKEGQVRVENEDTPSNTARKAVSPFTLALWLLLRRSWRACVGGSANAVYGALQESFSSIAQRCRRQNLALFQDFTNAIISSLSISSLLAEFVTGQTCVREKNIVLRNNQSVAR